MTLSNKVSELRAGAMHAKSLADFWQKQIVTYGEAKATAFYTHLGLNHIEKKGVEWEGLTLSREPTEAEKLCVKGIANAQESSKEKLITLLTQLRLDLVSDGLEGIRKLKPATYHELTLTASPESRARLRDRLIRVYKQGRMLVAFELSENHKNELHHSSVRLDIYESFPEFPLKADDDDEFDDLDELTDLTNSRVANDVQSRVISAVARFALLGLVGAQLWTAVSKELADGSVSYIDRTATGLANKVINIGRGDEARDRSDQWERVEYSALLDQNVCGPCAAEDGKEAASEDDLTPVPNPECEGGDWCRCVHVFVAEGNM